MRIPIARWLSWGWPVRIWKGRGRHGDLELAWEYGRLVVNTPNANQSFGSLHRVWQQAFRDARVAERKPRTALILGFGAGSAARILRTELGLSMPITGVDHDPVMLDLARRRFGVERLGHITLIEADAFHFAATDPGPYELVVVDLFHDLDLTPGVDSEDFLRTLRRLVAPGGLLLLNTVAYSPLLEERSARSGRNARLVFDDVQERYYEGNNRVFIAL